MSWKFNPPPGWPLPPDGSWVPPAGWAPDPSWPPAPPGWEFWVSGDTPTGPPSSSPPTSPTSPAAEVPPADPWPTPPPFQLPSQPVGQHPPIGQYPPVGTPPYQPTVPQPPAFPYPSSPASSGGFPAPVPPASPPRRGRSWAIAGAAGAAMLVVCTGGVVAVTANWDRLTTSTDDPSPTNPPIDASPGWDDCIEAPNTCNSGEVVAGSELVWGAWTGDDWNVHAASALSPTPDVMAGVAPSTGTFLPDGSWQWNLDLLAEEPVLTSDDPQTWQYRIRPEATWHDGTGITADDFAYLWRHNAGSSDLCEGCTPALTRGYERIASVEGSDGGRTVTVTMRNGDPYPEWWSLFTNLYPAHLAEAAGFDLSEPVEVADAATWFADTVPDWSGGPWRIATGDLLRQVVLEPNEAWYGQVHPSLDRIVFELDNDPTERPRALAAGMLDGTGPQLDPAAAPDPLPGVLSHVGSSYTWDLLQLNLERPGLDDVALRQAIFTVINVETIIDLSYDQPAADTTPKLNHIFRPDSPHYQDHLTGTGQGTGDAAAALAILDQAGYELDGTALTSDGESIGPLVLQHSEGHPRRAVMAELVRDQLAEIGIEVEIRPDLLSTVLDEADYDLVIYGWSGQPAFSAAGYQYWHRDSFSNFGKYQNDEVDRLVLDASYASDHTDAADLLNQAVAIVAEEAYVLPIAHTPEQHLVSDRFRNIRPNPTTTIFYNSHEWGMAAGE